MTVKLLTTFNQLAALSKDENVIIRALKKATSGLIEVDEGQKKVRRRKACREERVSYPYEMNVYGIDHYNEDDIHMYFSNFGKVLAVRLRKKKYVCVAFENDETLQKVLKQEHYLDGKIISL